MPETNIIFRQILRVTIIKLIKSVVAVNVSLADLVTGLIMRWTRSRLSKANLSKLAFPNCSDKLQLYQSINNFLEWS